ncbi:MAG: CPBP family intramembrane glutamic endopeptidase [Patescibacteria group bacterium]
MSTWAERLGFSKWVDFDHTHSFAGKLKNVFVVHVVNFAWVIMALFILTQLTGKTSQEITSILAASPFIGSGILLKLYPALAVSVPLLFFLAGILAPYWEERVFRVLVNKYGRKHEPDFNPKKWGFTWELMLCSSIIFGIMHGSPLNILFQGVGGFLYSYLYVKNNNSYWSIVLAHAMWNVSVIFLLPWFVNGQLFMFLTSAF